MASTVAGSGTAFAHPEGAGEAVVPIPANLPFPAAVDAGDSLTPGVDQDVQRRMRKRQRRRVGSQWHLSAMLRREPAVAGNGQPRIHSTLSVYVEPLMVAVTVTVFSPCFSVTLVHLQMWSLLLRVPRRVPLRVAVT